MWEGWPLPASDVDVFAILSHKYRRINDHCGQ